MTPKGVVGIGCSLLRERPGFFDARCVGFLFGGRGITPEGVVGIGHSLLMERTGIFDARCVGLLFSRGSGPKNVIFLNGPNFLSECSKLLY